MTRCAVILLLILILPASLTATTGRDLRSRIIIDGYTTDWETDEWVLDSSTDFPEHPGDSRWGLDNDIAAIAVTWDNYNVYVAVRAVTVSTELMLFLDTMCGGAADLTRQEFFRRNIEFGALTPNFLTRVDRAAAETLAGYIDCTRPFNLIENKRYQSVYRQDGVDDGVLEMALPWELIGGFERADSGMTVPADDTVLGVLGAITGGTGTGAGDAAPDPSVILETDSTRIAILDNAVRVLLDADDDGFVDIGVSPRDIALYSFSPDALGEPVRKPLPIQVRLEQKVFKPDDGGAATFAILLDPPDYELPVYVTARVFSAEGRLVRTLVEEQPMILSEGPVDIEWDMKDGDGGVVPGGIYLVAISGGAGEGTSKNTAKASFAIVR